MLAGGGEHHGDALYGRGIGNGSTFPLDDPVRAEVHLQLASVVGRDEVAPGSQARFLRVVGRLEVDQLVEPRDMFLRRDPPNAGRGRGRLQPNSFGQGAKKQVVVQEIALVWILVGMKTSLVLHLARKFTDDPVRETEAIDDGRLLLLLGRHLLERYLGPYRLPDRRIGLVHLAELKQVEVPLTGLVVMAIETMIFQKDAREIPEVPLGFFTGKIDVSCKGCPT